MWVQIRMAVTALLSETAMVSTVFRYGVLADATQLVLNGVDSPLHEVTYIVVAYISYGVDSPIHEVNSHPATRRNIYASWRVHNMDT